ncbi:MAG: NAD(P)H-dependent oxidoreductase [Treponema sp.]|nr:NAD(P)H-dependent oxidoreductase [Candidatus Treponema equifaecale]
MILHINCCTRKESRTKRLANALLEKLNGEVEEVNLYQQNLSPMTEDKLFRRSELSQKKAFSDDIFKFARQFAQADTIVVSVPFWDLSFPAVLKLYVENIYVTGLVTEYDKNGNPHGLCKAKKLYYVATAGGAFNPKYSFEYLKDLAQNYFGIKDVELIAAEKLDIEGMDSEKILEATIAEIKAN